MEFYDRLVYVARNLVEYKNYGGDPLKALKIVQKYFPGKSKEECNDQFTKVCEIYKAAIQFAHEHKEYYYLNDKTLFVSREKEFEEKYRAVPPSVVKHILGWVYNWHLDR
jgi:hypothetical protein